MRALVQRVQQAAVTVDGALVGEVGEGLLVLVCAMRDDGPETVTPFATRIAKLRVFRDAQGQMNRSLLDIGGAALVVSQFTLAADTRRGNRPGFSAAAAPETARALYVAFATAMGGLGVPVRTGRFGADMAVSLVNDGPVTIWLDSADRG